MNIKLATSLLGLAMLSACATANRSSVTTSNTRDFKSTRTSRYASNNTWGNGPAAPAEAPVGATADIPAEGPAELERNPAIMPSPLLRNSAIASP